MFTKPTINILFAIALLSPVVSSASCLDSNDPAKNLTAGNCDITSEKPPASEQQLVQNQLSTTGDFPANSAASKSDTKKAPARNDTEFDNYNWIPADWYEVY